MIGFLLFLVRGLLDRSYVVLCRFVRYLAFFLVADVEKVVRFLCGVRSGPCDLANSPGVNFVSSLVDSWVMIFL